MKERLKLIYGTDKINYLQNYITLNSCDELNIYKDENNFLAVYGKLLCSNPTETIKIKIQDDKKSLFPNEKEIYDFITKGENKNLENQKKIYTVAKIQNKYGKQIIEKQKEIKLIIENMIKNGEKKKSFNCKKEYSGFLAESITKSYPINYETTGDTITLIHN